MYEYIDETIYLLGIKGSDTFPLVKVVADIKGVKVFGLSKAHKGQEAHAEKYAEGEDGRLDTSHGHLHFRDDKAVKTWQDKVYNAKGARPGIRGGCSLIPPLDDLCGYIPIVTLGFSLIDVASEGARPKHYKHYHLAVNLNDYKSSLIYVEVLLKGRGSKELFSNFELSNAWGSVIFDKKEPNIVFVIRDKV